MEAGLTKFQALYRGFKTRQAMKATRSDFEEIFNEIEGATGSKILLEWPKNNGRPKLVCPNLSVDSCLKSTPRYEKNNPIDLKTFENQCCGKEREDSYTSGVYKANGNIAVLLTESKSTVNNLMSESSSDRYISKTFAVTEDDCKGKSMTKSGTAYDLKLKAVFNIADAKLGKAHVLKIKDELEMELLWVQQAIDSRKKYLMLKS